MSINILKYESDIWKTADLLIGAGIKQSDFPKYMMPFFALAMVESRLIREANRIREEENVEDIEDFVEIFYELYQADYPIEQIRLIDEYNADDDLSCLDNNTSCFNYRVVSGTTKLSKHARGLAIDINTLSIQNDD